MYQILKKRNVDIAAAGMSEDGLSPLEETLAGNMQVGFMDGFLA